MQLRRLTTEDVNFCEELENKAFPPTDRWGGRRLQEAINKSNIAYGLLDSYGQLTGFIFGNETQDGFEILNIAVIDEGLGHGQALIKPVLDRPDKIILSVRLESTRAIEFYKKSGFHPVGSTKTRLYMERPATNDA